MLRVMSAVMVILFSVGCAEQHHAKLPMNSGVKIQFTNLQNGRCTIADVLVDAKSGIYTVICRKEK